LIAQGSRAEDWRGPPMELINAEKTLKIKIEYYTPPSEARPPTSTSSTDTPGPRRGDFISATASRSARSCATCCPLRAGGICGFDR
jgi:hypothetical protein